jgi:hypothetical protein
VSKPYLFWLLGLAFDRKQLPQVVGNNRKWKQAIYGLESSLVRPSQAFPLVQGVSCSLKADRPSKTPSAINEGDLIQGWGNHLPREADLLEPVLEFGQGAKTIKTPINFQKHDFKSVLARGATEHLESSGVVPQGGVYLSEAIR